jgi:sortase (surface protein transpeptidase)
VRRRPGQGRPRPRAPQPPDAGSTRRRSRRAWAGLAGTLAALGTGLILTAALSQQHAPAPPRDLGTIPAAQSLTPAGTSPRQPQRGQALWTRVRSSPALPPPAAARAAASTLALPRSVPVTLAIPAIGVHATVIKLGLNPDRTLQVPPLTPAGVKQAGWYDRGPAPGQTGPAVIAGHVDSYQGPGAFFRLGALRPGDQIDVTRADRTTAVFRINAVDEYTKTSFPTQQVYGPVTYAGLRLITCGGQFDYQTRHYRSNIVIYATLTGSRNAKSG